MTLVTRTHAVALAGVRGHVVQIEAGLQAGTPALVLAGLPDAAARSARERIRSAVVVSEQRWPVQRVRVTVSPASLPKRGRGFDVGVAVAILAVSEMVPAASLAGTVFVGELGPDGWIRHVPGVLPAVAAAAGAGFTRAVVPPPDAAEALLVPGMTVVTAPTLRALAAWLRGRPLAAGGQLVRVLRSGGLAPGTGSDAGDGGRELADVAGQPAARRAAEICAAGGHHLLLVGPPAAGTTMLARRLPAIMPPLERAAALEVSALHSVAGMLPPGRPLITRPPLVAPHHGVTRAAIAGGGSGLIRPGAASLAHRGCLVLDQAPQFSREALDALRQPLDSGEVMIARGGLTARFPARFTLVATTDPCPCARSAARGSACTCTPLMQRRYLARLSRPLLDRIEVKVKMAPAGRAELLRDRRNAEPGAVVAERVRAARERAARRLAGTPWRLNAEVPGSELRRQLLRPAPGALAPLERAVDLGQVSARGAHRVIGLSWTLADLAGTGRPRREEVSCGLALWLGKEPGSPLAR